MFVAFHATIFTLGKSSMLVLLSLSQMVVTLRLSPSPPPSSDGDKKNKPTSLDLRSSFVATRQSANKFAFAFAAPKLAGIQEKPYIARATRA